MPAASRNSLRADHLQLLLKIKDSLLFLFTKRDNLQFGNRTDFIRISASGEILLLHSAVASIVGDLRIPWQAIQYR